jgi:4-hydroxybenzoate polyprenyltransferase
MSEHPPVLQVVLMVVVPAIYGALTGIFLGISEPVYLVLSIAGIVGAVGAGYDHLGARAGALRGLLAGAVFGLSILIAHELSGQEAEAHLPDPAILLLVITVVPGVLFAAIGGKLRLRTHHR